ISDFRPVRKAPPPPRPHSSASARYASEDFLIIDVNDNLRSKTPQPRNHNGMPRCSSQPTMQKKKAPPPRPPPPKVNPSQKTQAHHNGSRNFSVKSGSVMGGVLGKLRGPPPRPKASHVHQTTSAPSTPSSEACLIKFDSPPDSPNMRSGSDGLSLNSFGSEGSSGNHSSGFDDSFDPFGSIQEPVYGFVGGKKLNNTLAYGGPPLGFQQPDIFSSSNNKSTVNSNFNGNGTVDPFGDVPQQENLLDSQDPFELIAKRIEAPMAPPPELPLNTSQPVSITNNIGQGINWNTTQTSTIQQTSVQQPMQPQPTAPPLQQASQIQSAADTKPKTSFRATIIRPKAAVTGNQVASAGGSDISRELSGMDLNTTSTKPLGLPSSIGWDSSIVEQTIQEEPPPLPPRPEEEGDEDSPYGVAEFDFEGTQQDDLGFKVGNTIQLLYRVSEDWLFGRCGHSEGMFPQSFIKIVVPLAGEAVPDQASNSSTPTNTPAIDTPTTDSTSTTSAARIGTATNIVTALYTFMAEQHGDLTIYEGDDIKIIGRISDEWLLGESSGRKGQFPANFIENVPDDLPQI
ncbi:unnamed protein product, partial [Meganyctiphanes norvegica]